MGFRSFYTSLPNPFFNSILGILVSWNRPFWLSPTDCTDIKQDDSQQIQEMIETHNTLEH